MINKILVPVLLIGLLLVAWERFGRDIFIKNPDVVIVKETKEMVVSPTVTEATQKSDIPEGWQRYTNEEYGFTVLHPTRYKVLTSKDDLYGWENAIVLFYGGGQAHDVAVEVWDSKTEYEEKYVDVDLTVYPIGEKFVTMYDSTKQPDNKTLIESFELVK